MYDVSGGQVVHLNVSNLGEVTSVLVGLVVAPIISRDADSLAILLPPLGDGIHPIYLKVRDKGYMVTNT